jgi:hypothetical protein
MTYSFAKTEFPREPKPVDSLDGFQELSPVRILSGKPEQGDLFDSAPTRCRV